MTLCTYGMLNSEIQSSQFSSIFGILFAAGCRQVTVISRCRSWKWSDSSQSAPRNGLFHFSASHQLISQLLDTAVKNIRGVSVSFPKSVVLSLDFQFLVMTEQIIAVIFDNSMNVILQPRGKFSQVWQIAGHDLHFIRCWCSSSCWRQVTNNVNQHLEASRLCLGYGMVRVGVLPSCPNRLHNLTSLVLYMTCFQTWPPGASSNRWSCFAGHFAPQVCILWKNTIPTETKKTLPHLMLQKEGAVLWIPLGFTLSRLTHPLLTLRSCQQEFFSRHSDKLNKISCTAFLIFFILFCHHLQTMSIFGFLAPRLPANFHHLSRALWAD